ncbi:SET domain-containing protein [Sarocladium implicatum]|nr:SET domain-containing protein [Sarocladium implicatum]
MEAIENLLEWATAQGVEMKGIEPKHLPGRGIGLVATRKIEVGEAILVVPSQLLRTISNTPKPMLRKLKGTSVHSILAASLCLEKDPVFELWRAVFPTKEDITQCMPFFWPQELQDLLPDAAMAVLKKQQIKVAKDWKRVSAAYSDIDELDFQYNWHLVNSRTFYHVTPRTEKLHKDDHMVLQPVADLFNHDPNRGCSVAFDAADYTITTKHVHEPGDEVFIQYGNHSNDMLLAEYGFILPSGMNRWDETTLDTHLCPRFSSELKQKLEDAGFWAEYKLDADTPVCYRTQVALRALFLNERQWRQVASGIRGEDRDREEANKELLEVLRPYEKEIRATIRKIEGLKVGDEEMRETLRKRWVQIKELVVSAIASIEQERSH